MRARSSLVCLTDPLQTPDSSTRSRLILPSSFCPVVHSRAKKRDIGESTELGLARDSGSVLSHSSACDLRVVIHAGLAVSDREEESGESSSSSVVRILRNLPTAASPTTSQPNAAQ